MTRKPPHDLDAERALIGVALLDTARALATELNADAFYPPAHQHIWHAITQAAGQVDAITLAAALAADGHQGDIYSAEHLGRMMADTPAVSNARRYAAIIAEHYERRQVIHAAAILTEHAYNGAYDTLLAAVETVKTTAVAATVEEIATVDWGTFWDADVDPEDWLIYPLVPRGRMVALYAAAKAGKSTILLAAIAAAVTGRSILGMGRQGHRPTVLYLDYEMTAADLAERLGLLGYGPGDDLSRLHYALLPSMPPLDTPAGSRALLKHAKACGAELVVVDTFGRAVQGEENEADTVRAFYRHSGLALKAAGIAILRTDHAGKDNTKGQRGSSAKNDDVDVVWQLSRTDSGVILKRTHSRVTWVPDHLTIDQHANDDRVSYTERRGEAYLPGTREAMALLDDLGVSHATSARKAAAMLRDAGHRVANDVLRAAQRARKNDAYITGETTTQRENSINLTAPQVFRRGLDDENHGAASGALRRAFDDATQTHTNTEEEIPARSAARSGAVPPHQTGAPPLYIERRARRASDDAETDNPESDEMEYPF